MSLTEDARTHRGLAVPALAGSLPLLAAGALSWTLIGCALRCATLHTRR